MPKTKHPKDVAKEEHSPLKASHFTLGNNADRNTQQANMTYSVTAAPNTTLGSNGETRGFAKRHPQPNEKPKGTTQLYQGDAPKGNRTLITRQVASSVADKVLGLNVIAEERFGVDEHGATIGVSIQADGCNIASNKGILQVDCRDPRIQKGLSDLQVMDYITGQLNRHSGNIFINPATGMVTGIDNDLAFSEKNINDIGGEPMDKMVGMPKRIHEDSARKILSTDPEELRARLSTPPPNGAAPLSKASINGAVDRLKEMQAELLKVDGAIKVVKAFDNNTYQEEVDAMEVGFKEEQRRFLSYIPGFQPRTTQEYLQMSDEDRAKFPPRLIQKMDTVPKTSYLASVELELAKNRMLQGRAQVQAEHVDAPKATRNLQAVFEKKLSDGYGQMTRDQQKNFDKDLAQLNKLEGELATKEKHLLKPSFKDQLKALTGGGMRAVLDQKRDHAADIADEIADLRTKLEQRADKALGITPQVITAKVSQDDTAKSGSTQLSRDDNGGIKSTQDTSSLEVSESESLGGNVPRQDQVNEQAPSLERRNSVRELMKPTQVTRSDTGIKTGEEINAKPKNRVK